MPVAEHPVSSRANTQVRVRGLQPSLRQMGYQRHAQVRVTDPADPSHEPWVFIVQNDEDATLTCNNPVPPAWIQAGVLIRIDVQPPAGVIPAGQEQSAAHSILPPTRVLPGEVPAPVRPRPELPPHVVYAVDVGSPGAGLAWARLAPNAGQIPSGSMDFGLFLELIVRDLQADLPVALGFEAPMFLPVAATLANLTRARQGESAAWSAGAGAWVTAAVIPLMAFTMRHIASQVRPAPRVTLDQSRWLAPDATGSHLLLWEAFVSGDAHARAANAAGLAVHLQDAATAVHAFVQWEATSPRPPSDIAAHDPISTAGAAVLWSGLGDDLSLLHRQTLVLRPLQLLGAGVVAYVPEGTTVT